MPPLLGEILFWISASLCVVAQIAILRSAFRSQGSAASTGSSPMPAVRRTPELVWAILPAVALLVVLVLTWRAMHA